MMSAQENTAPGVGTRAMIQFDIEEMLEKRGRSAYWLAKETGLTHTALYRLRRAKTGAIKFETLDAICQALDCEPGDVLKRVHDSPKAKRTAKA